MTGCGSPMPSPPAGDDTDTLRRQAACLLALQEAACDRRRLADDLDRLHGSLSWRLTAPLRRLRAWLFPPTPAAPVLAPAHPGDADTLEDPTTLLRRQLGLDARALPAQAPRLYVDVTELACEDLVGGIQRTTRRILAEWLLAPPQGLRVEPVRLAADGRYVHARAHLARMLGLAHAQAGADVAVAARAGDRFVGRDLVRDHVPQARPALAALRAQGSQGRACLRHVVAYQVPADEAVAGARRHRHVRARLRVRQPQHPRQVRACMDVAAIGRQAHRFHPQPLRGREQPLGEDAPGGALDAADEVFARQFGHVHVQPRRLCGQRPRVQAKLPAQQRRGVLQGIGVARVRRRQHGRRRGRREQPGAQAAQRRGQSPAQAAVQAVEVVGEPTPVARRLLQGEQAGGLAAQGVGVVAGRGTGHRAPAAGHRPPPAIMQAAGAGEGNRTLVSCLGSNSSTIELHPPSRSIMTPRPR